jgi:glutamate-1-semialdehyde aminotransferase
MRAHPRWPSAIRRERATPYLAADGRSYADLCLGAPVPLAETTRAVEFNDLAGLERYLHLQALNRGVLITPFHNVARICPATTAARLDRHSELFDAALGELFG